MDFKYNREYMTIYLTDLFFDENVADMVEYQDCKFPTTLLNNIYSTGAFKLNQQRLDSLLSIYKTGLPPISVKKEFGEKYTVINGRHRICATIINGDNTIQCNKN